MIFETVAKMKLAKLTAGQIISTKGYYVAGDGGGASYLVAASQTVDGYGDHALAGGTVALLQTNGNVDVKQYGAAGDGVTDDTAAFSAAAAAAVSAMAQTQGNIIRAATASVLVPAGNYNITSVVDTSGKEIRWVMQAGAVIPSLSTKDGPLEDIAVYDHPNLLFGHVYLEGQRVSKRPNGTRDQACGFSAQISPNPQRGSGITGFSEYSSVAAYTDRDAVGIYGDAYADPNEQILVDPVSSYTTTRVNFTTPLITDHVVRLRDGMIIDTRHTVADGNKWSGIITDWDISGSWIEVGGWFQAGNGAAGQTPSGTTGVLINPITKIWGANFQAKIPSNSYAHAATGIEVGMTNWKQDSERFTTGQDRAVDDSPFYMWGMHITNFAEQQGGGAGNYKLQAHLALDGKSWYGITTNANVENGLYHTGGGSALITQNDSLTTRGRVLNSGRYFGEVQTATVTDTPDENTNNTFYWDAAWKFGFTSGPTFTLGQQYDASTPIVNLKCSGGNIGYDARIRATNGDATHNGNGQLRIEADGTVGKIYLDAEDILIDSSATRFRPATHNSVTNGTSANRWSETYSVEFHPGAVGDVVWTNGTGTPEGQITAPIGSMFTRRDGGASSTLYVKESGTGNTGWVAK